MFAVNLCSKRFFWREKPFKNPQIHPNAHHSLARFRKSWSFWGSFPSYATVPCPQDSQWNIEICNINTFPLPYKPPPARLVIYRYTGIQIGSGVDRRLQKLIGLRITRSPHTMYFSFEGHTSRCWWRLGDRLYWTSSQHHPDYRSKSEISAAQWKALLLKIL